MDDATKQVIENVQRYSKELERMGVTKPATEPRDVPLQIGETVDVNGVPMKVLNFTDNSVTVRPEEPLILIVKGVPTYIHKVVNHRDLVLRRFTKQMAQEIIKGTSPQ